ncbi:MAG: M20/M25/M40 family metallo-hydrolase [Wenzhouxiangella sp.]
MNRPLRKIGLIFSLAALLAIASASAELNEIGALAEREMRALAVEFPGRMAGSDQERAAAEHLMTRLQSFGLAPELQSFPVRFTHLPLGADEPVDFEGMSQNVIINLPGRSDRLLIVGAHYDTAVAWTPEQAEAGIGGPELQGLDDNASGVGVLLELAARLAGAEPDHAIRLIFFGAEEVGLQGARHAVAAMSSEERERVKLMINIDNIITGDNLYVHAGPFTVAADPAHGAGRDRVLEMAAELGIALETNPGLNQDYPAGTGCCSDQVAFDEAGIPVVNFEATNWRLGNLDGYQQTEISAAFPAGETWHNRYLDRIEHLEAHLPSGRLSERPAQVVQILLPFVQETAGL